MDLGVAVDLYTCRMHLEEAFDGTALENFIQWVSTIYWRELYLGLDVDNVWWINPDAP